MRSLSASHHPVLSVLEVVSLPRHPDLFHSHSSHIPVQENIHRMPLRPLIRLVSGVLRFIWKGTAYTTASVVGNPVSLPEHF